MPIDALSESPFTPHVHATFCVITTRRPQGKQNMKAGVRKNGNFCSAMLYVSAVYAGRWCRSVCLSVCPSVCLSRSWIMSKRIIIFEIATDAEYLRGQYPHWSIQLVTLYKLVKNGGAGGQGPPASRTQRWPTP